MICKASSLYSENKKKILFDDSLTENQKVESLLSFIDFDKDGIEQLSDLLYKDIFNTIAGNSTIDIGVDFIYKKDNGKLMRVKNINPNSPFSDTYTTDFDLYEKKLLKTSEELKNIIDEKKSVFTDIVKTEADKILNNNVNIESSGNSDPKTKSEIDDIGNNEVELDDYEEPEGVDFWINEEVKAINSNDGILTEGKMKSIYFVNHGSLYEKVFKPFIKNKLRIKAFGLQKNIKSYGITTLGDNNTIDISLDGDNIVKEMLFEIYDKYTLGKPYIYDKLNKNGSVSNILKQMERIMGNSVRKLFLDKGISNIDELSSSLTGISESKDMQFYMDYVFVKEFKSVVTEILPLLSIKKNKNGSIKFITNNNISNNESFHGNYSREGQKKADLNTEFIKFMITSTPNIISVENIDDSTLIRWFSDTFNKYTYDNNLSNEENHKRQSSNIREEFNNRKIRYIQDKDTPFFSQEQYNMMSVDNKFRSLVNKDIDKLSEYINNDDNFGRLSDIFRVFYTGVNDSVYLDLDNKRMVVKPLLKNVNELLPNINSINSGGTKVNSNFQKIYFALMNDFISHDKRNQIKDGSIIDSLSLDAKSNVNNILNSNLYNSDLTGVDNNLHNKVNITSNSNGDVLLEIEVNSGEIFKIQIEKPKDNFYNEVIVNVKKGDKSISDLRSIKEILKSLNFPKEILDYNGLSSVFGDIKGINLPNFVANYALGIYLNSNNVSDINNEPLLKKLGVTLPISKFNEDIPFDIYNMLWPFRKKIEEVGEKIYGIDGDGFMIIGDGKVQKLTLKDNSDFLKELGTHELDGEDGFFHESAFSSSVSKSRFRYKGKGIEPNAFKDGKVINTSDLSMGEMVSHAIRSTFVDSINKSRNKSVLLQVIVSERKLTSIHGIDAIHGNIIPIKDKRIDFDKLKSNVIESKGKVISAVNRVFKNKMYNLFDVESKPYINTGEINFDFVNKNIVLIETIRENSEYSSLEDAIGLIAKIQNGIKQSLISSDDGNFMYFFDKFLETVDINYSIANKIGLSPNSEIHKVKNSEGNNIWRISDYMIYEYDLWNNKTYSNEYVFNGETFDKLDSPRYDEESTDKDMAKKVLSNQIKEFSQKMSSEIGRGNIISYDRKNNFLNTLGIKNISNYELLTIYKLINDDVNVNLTPFLLGHEYQYLSKVKEYSKTDSKTNSRIEYISNTETVSYYAKAKRAGLLETRGKAQLTKSGSAVSPKTELHASFDDPIILVNALGTMDEIDNERYDGQQLLSPLSIFQKELSYNSSFGFNIKDFAKTILLDMNHKTGISFIEKTGSHVLKLEDMKNSDIHILESMWSVPFRDENNKLIKIYVPVIKDNNLTGKFIPKNEQESQLTDSEEIYNSVGEINNMFELFEYLGGYNNPNVIEQIAYTISLQENKDISNKHISVLTFLSSNKSGSPVLNDSNVLYDSNKKVLTYEVNKDSEFLVLSKHEDTNESHSLSANTQAIAASNFGIENKNGDSTITSLDNIRSLNKEISENELVNTLSEVILDDKLNDKQSLLAYSIYQNSLNGNIINAISNIINNDSSLENDIKTILVSIFKKGMSNRIFSTNSSDSVIRMIQDDNISLNGVLSKVSSSMIRTTQEKNPLDVRFEGIGNIAQNINGIVNIYEMEDGNTVLKNDYFNKKSKTESVDLFTDSNRIDKIKEEIFNNALNKNYIIETNC